MTKKNLILLILLFTGCKHFEKQDIPVKPMKYPSPNSIYRRDSLYIAITVREFMNKKVDIFDAIKQEDIPVNKVYINIDSLIYSPDSLKIFSFCIINEPVDSTCSKYYYTGNSFIGYRKSKKEPWIIYYFDQCSVAGFDNYNKVRNIFRFYYFSKFKFDSEYIWDSLKKDRVTAYFGYNLNEKNFWTKSVVWKKGARLPGLYNFQTKGNVKPGDEGAVKIIPHLDYPDSLLKLYR